MKTIIAVIAVIAALVGFIALRTRKPARSGSVGQSTPPNMNRDDTPPAVDDTAEQ